MRGDVGADVRAHADARQPRLRLRRKLCGDGDDKLVINVWGVGYRLD